LPASTSMYFATERDYPVATRSKAVDLKGSGGEL